jgi:membrane-associated phospholipid phosphatase
MRAGILIGKPATMRGSLQVLLSVVIASATILVPDRATAQSSDSAAHPTLKNTSPGFLALETAGALVILGGYSIALGDPPETCKWCEPTGFDKWVRNGLVASHPKTAGYVSHGLSLGVVPIGALAGLYGSAASEGHASTTWQDAWIMVNTFILTTGITDGTKKVVARERPGFYYGRQSETEAADHPSERNLSFFSGDTSWAFSLAACGSTLAFLHGYRAAPWIAAGTGVAASAAGVLRIVGDMHWATDVMTGAVVGTGIGIALPLLLHGRTNEGTTSSVVTPLIGGLERGVMVSGSF